MSTYPVYPEDLRNYVKAERAKGLPLKDIAEGVRNKWPQYGRFSDVSVRAMTRHRVERKSVKDIEYEQKMAAIVERSRNRTCPYMTIDNYKQGGCGKPGDPYCAEHRAKVSGGPAGAKFANLGSGLRSML